MADYIMHFNRLHNPKNGRFDFGDGDGDGQVNDRRTSLRERMENERNYHRNRILDTEKYKISRDSLRLQQDQIANKRNIEQLDVKSRNRLDKLDRAEKKRMIYEEKTMKLIDRARRKSLIEVGKAEAKADKAIANAARKEAKLARRLERSATAGQVTAGIANGLSRAGNRIRYNHYTNMTNFAIGEGFVSLLTGRPLRSIRMFSAASANSKKAERASMYR